jgi:integrase
MHRPKPSVYLLSDVIDEYLEASKGTKRSWRDDVRWGKAWKVRFPGCTLEDITPLKLEQFRSERLKTVSPATVNREFAYLKHVFNLAIRDERTERNPVAKLKMLREPSGRVRFLSDAEEKSLREILATDEDQERLTVLVQTGLRRTEFLDLPWRDVDLKNGVITIRRSKNGETRHVPMTSEVRSILSNRPRPLNSGRLVFPNSVGHPDHHWAQKAFPEAVEAARIEDFRFHDTRHTFASRLAMAGVDVLTIKDLGGWKSLSMVQRYAHLSPSHRQQAIERLVGRQSDPQARHAPIRE